MFGHGMFLFKVKMPFTRNGMYLSFLSSLVILFAHEMIPSILLRENKYAVSEWTNAFIVSRIPWFTSLAIGWFVRYLLWMELVLYVARVPCKCLSIAIWNSQRAFSRLITLQAICCNFSWSYWPSIFLLQDAGVIVLPQDPEGTMTSRGKFIGFPLCQGNWWWLRTNGLKILYLCVQLYFLLEANTYMYIITAHSFLLQSFVVYGSQLRDKIQEVGWWYNE